MTRVLCILRTLLILAVVYQHANGRQLQAAFYNNHNIECGPYGFTCEGKNRLRLCEGDNLIGPAFLCPSNTICNEDSNDVCENVINYIDPSITRNFNCRRSERIADPTVPNCKGYILCINNKRNRFQGIKFKCTGNTIFNGYTRTCSAPDKYRCPLANTNRTSFIDGEQSNEHGYHHSGGVSGNKNRSIDCKNYKFRVTEDSQPVRATYFCPTHPVRIGEPIKCTVFSNEYCLTLERDDQDQFAQQSGTAYRRPRMNKT